MAEFLTRHPEKRSVLSTMHRDFGLTMEVAIYALLATTDTADDISSALFFVFEADEDSGLMQHEYVRPVPANV